MPRLHFSLVLFAAALLSACATGTYIESPVAPLVNALDAPAPAAGTPCPEAFLILASTRSFDQSYESYSSQFEAGVQTLSDGAQGGSLPIEGLAYFFDEHVLAICRAYEELARASERAGDWTGAEAFGLDAAAFAEQRAYSDFARAEGARDAWTLLEKIQGERKSAGGVLVAQVRRKLAEDFLNSTDGKAARHAFYDQEFADKSRALRLNQFIFSANLQKTREALDNAAGALGALESRVADRQIRQINSQANSQGSMTRSQAAQLQSAQIAKVQSSVLRKMNQGLGGASSGDPLSIFSGKLDSLSLRQFLLPSSGVDPTGIVARFGELVKVADPDLSASADRVVQSAQRLATARHSGGDPAQTAFEQFWPEFQALLADVRKEAP